MISVSDLYRTEADPDDQIRGWVRLSVIGNESKFNKITELDTGIGVTPISSFFSRC